MIKNKPEAADYLALRFYPLYSGGITVFHRPSIRGIAALAKNTPCTVIFTLQSETESPHDIESACKINGLSWVWVCLQGANNQLLKSNKASSAIRNGLFEAKKRLQNGEFLYVHCAAGIHRTGLFLYALLRISGFSRSETMDIIKEIRVHTYERCGEHRFEIAEGIALSILDGKIGKMIRGLESMHSCESIENPYFWMKLSITHKEFLRFECILTDRDMQQYVNGKTVDLEIQFKSLRKQLGKEWLDAKEVKYCEEDIKISAFNAFERELSDFCRESFEESKGVLIGRRINLEKQFIVAFWPSLNAYLTEDLMILPLIEDDSSLVSDILHFKLS